MIEWYTQFTFLSCHYNIMCFSTRTVHEAIYAEREFVDYTDHVARIALLPYWWRHAVIKPYLVLPIP